MSDHITEEEQIEAAKRWWNENGKSVVIGVVVAVVGYFGWQGWQTQQKTAAESASLLFEDMMQAAVVEPGQTITEDQLLKAQTIAEELKEDHSGSLYSNNAALWMAKLAVESGDLEKAHTELEWVIDHDANEGVEFIARLRLAQVQYSQKEFDKALSTLDEVKAGAFDTSFNELRGDIYVAQEKIDLAIETYEKILSDSNSAQSSRRDIVQMKLDNAKDGASQSVSAEISDPETSSSKSQSDEKNTKAES
ncbi:MAG: tetratricopeptide repeat protein [Cellvibrionaceae bacterium]